MLPQLDLREEASHLKRFNHDFSGDDRVSFPQPILTTSKVLVETFSHGSPILSYLQAPEDQRKELAKLGLQTVLKMIFLYDFVHGDLHPGNILVENTGSFLKLHLLDCGLVIEMGPEQHINVVKVLGAFVRKDGVLAGQLMVDNGAKKQASDLDVQLFVEGIEQIVLEDANNVCAVWGGSCSVVVRILSILTPNFFVLTEICGKGGRLHCRHLLLGLQAQGQTGTNLYQCLACC
jgi:aarF domain-containing kinase